MPGRDIIVLGASLGGVTALSRLVAGLPRDLPAAVFVVLHTGPRTSVLPDILTAAGPLPAHHPVDGEPFEQGRIYVAPPDHHLLVGDGVVRLSRGPRQNRARPAVDPLFRSAAGRYGARVVGVVLTGALDCGAAGLVAVRRRGGICVVQDPGDAYCPDMPRNALEAVGKPDFVLPLDGMPALLERLARTAVTGGTAAVASDPRMTLDDASEGMLPSGAPTAFSCPDCGGVLFERSEGDLPYFMCRTGHGYSVNALVEGQEEMLEGALWAALRALEERGALLRRMARRARDHGHARSSERHDEAAVAAEEQARLVREALRRGVGDTAQTAPAEPRKDDVDDGPRGDGP